MEDLSEAGAGGSVWPSFASLARIAAHEVRTRSSRSVSGRGLNSALASGPDAWWRWRRGGPEILERVEHLREVARGLQTCSRSSTGPEVIDLAELAREVAAEYDVLASGGWNLRVLSDGAEIVADAQWNQAGPPPPAREQRPVVAGRAGEIVVAVRRVGESGALVRDSGGGVRRTDGRLSSRTLHTSEGTGWAAVGPARRLRAGGSVEASTSTAPRGPGSSSRSGVRLVA